ncbi:hypothetical protein AHF37_11207 [Paragonimus kellicotti]|nr:hypothetical protein AHF37_11207 [Paragonimus kellicotti]
MERYSLGFVQNFRTQQNTSFINVVVVCGCIKLHSVHITTYTSVVRKGICADCHLFSNPRYNVD